MPAIIHPDAHGLPSTKKDRIVGFPKDPVTDVSRPATSQELWKAYDFELHATNCAYCRDPYEVHRNHEQLCDVGHRLAQEVTTYLYNRSDGKTYSTVDEHSKLVRIELPSGYTQVRALLRAVERSIRHRSRTPFVSQERTHHLDTRSVKVVQSPKPKSQRPRSGEIVDWPDTNKAVSAPAPAVSSYSHSHSKRGSLYQQDLATLRHNAKQYKVEIREPSRRDVREYRSSGYYR